MKTRNEQIIGFLVFIGLVFLVAGLGGWLTSQSVNSWYPTLEKPAGTPPGWVFGPVWTTLYVLMALSGWWLWRQYPMKQIKTPLLVFLAQLILNGLWSGLFFGLQNPLAGLVDIVLLWCLIVATIYLFWKKSPFAGALLVPYLLWVSYAAWLNFGIWWLNS